MKPVSNLSPQEEAEWVRSMLTPRPVPIPPKHIQKAMTVKQRRIKHPVHVSDCEGGAHHWRIEEADGPLSNGVCKRCGKTRTFRNSSEEMAFSEAHRLSKRFPKRGWRD